MIIRKAINLKIGDIVTIKKSKQKSKIIDKIYIEKKYTTNNIAGLSIKLENNNWYGYKEIS